MIVWDNAAVATYLGESGPVGADLMRRTLNVHAEAVRRCPVNTGRLRSSIRWSLGKDSRGIVATVGTDVDYAGYVTGGTAPHDIYPVTMKSLYWPGAAHPVAVVHHPGTRGNDFLSAALLVAAS